MDPIYRQLVDLLDRHQPLAFAVLTETKGSTPQKCGAKAIFLPDGRILGTLGGGCLEAETRQKALRALETGEPFTFRAVLDDDFGWDDGLICGGSVQTFVQPNPKSHEVWRALLDGANARQRRLLVTVTSGEYVGARVLFAEGRILSTDDLPQEMLEQLAAKSAEVLAEPESEPSSFLFPPSSLSAYFEPLLPKPVLVICGGGHVGCAVGRLAAWSGFDVVAIDDRASFANQERFPEARRILVEDPAKVMREFPIDDNTYIVIVTRGHRHDAVILREVIHSPAAYIGMIGSRRKVRTILEAFVDERIATPDELRRVRSPIGLNIHSITVEEIAVSIMAELIATRRGQTENGPLSVTPEVAGKLEGRGRPPGAPTPSTTP